MQKRPRGKHGVEIVLRQTELIQLQVLDCSLLVLKLERKKKFMKKYYILGKITGRFQIKKNSN